MGDTFNDGGPAFPVSREAALNPVTDMGGNDVSSGMSLRAWFAGQALPQAVEDYDRTERGFSGKAGNHILPYAVPAIGTREDIIAWQAVRYADALIAELGRGRK